MKSFFVAVIAVVSLAVSMDAQVEVGTEATASPAAPAEAPAVDPSGFAYVPMSAHERWHGYLHENMLGSKFVLQVFGSALISHISRDPVQWGVGSHGYIHRVEDRLETFGIDGAVHSSLAAALHHDTRYWRYHGNGRGIRRAGHALERTILTYNESGDRVVDVSALAGIYGSSMTATLWHPRVHDRMLRGVEAGNFGMIGQAAGNLIKEFGPDLKHIILRK
jgi:hypothetical protein